jgi:hypothetical protein
MMVELVTICHRFGLLCQSSCADADVYFPLIAQYAMNGAPKVMLGLEKAGPPGAKGPDISQEEQQKPIRKNNDNNQG